MDNQSYIELNITKSSKLLHDYLPAIIVWIIIVYIVIATVHPLFSSSKIIIGITTLITFPVILYFTHKQSKSYKLDMKGLTISTTSSTPHISWDKVESISKVGRGDGLIYELLDQDGHKYNFPLDSRLGRTETFLDSLAQLKSIPTKNAFDNYSARWKNITSKSYKYTSFADKFMNFSYGNPNSN